MPCIHSHGIFFIKTEKTGACAQVSGKKLFEMVMESGYRLTVNEIKKIAPGLIIDKFLLTYNLFIVTTIKPKSQCL
jgi:hypothetical protein